MAPAAAPQKQKKAAAESINARLALVMKSGKVAMGFKSGMKAVTSGKAKLVVIAANCPPVMKCQIEYYSHLTRVDVCQFAGSNIELGTACGKFFRVSLLVITDPGDSDIIKAVSKE